MGLWTNLLQQSANIDDTASPWADNTPFTIAEVVSAIPGQVAHRHEWGGSGTTSRKQTAGVMPDPAIPHALITIFENVNASSSSCRIWDGSVGIVSGVRFNWSTRATSSTGSTFGSDVSRGFVDLETGPNGGDMVGLWTVATPDQVGGGREVFIFPGGAATTNSGDTAILHYAGLFEASTFSPAMLVNGSTIEERRVVDLDAHKVRIRPRQTAESLTHRRPRASGKMSTALHSDAVRARTWSLETEIEDRATGEALQADLDAPGTVHVVHNPLIHPVTGVAVECVAENVQRRDGPQEEHVRLGFDLREVRPL